MIDTDKIDYLKRDSLHCGVAFGENFHIDEIIRSISCDQKCQNILFKQDYLASIEGFMILQDQMLTSVYWHERVRAVFAMLHRFLDATIKKDRDVLVEVVDQMKKCISEQECVEKVLLPILGRGGTKEELLPLIRLHSRPNSKDIYLPFSRFGPFDRLQRSQRFRVYDTIVTDPNTRATRGNPINWDKIQVLRRSFFHAFQKHGANPGRFEILVDVPWGKFTNNEVSIFDERSDELHKISDISNLSDSMFRKAAAFRAPIRIFVSPHLYQEFYEKENLIYETAMNAYFSGASLDVPD